MSEQHKRFLERLDASSRAVFLVAMMQHAKGRTVQIPKVRKAPTAAVAKDYIDNGDAFIMIEHRIDVKHRGVPFTCREDWPYDTVFVSSVASVDRANGETLAYVTISKDFGCAAIIMRDTRAHWLIEEERASNTGNIERYYSCPKELVTFEKLT